jgi:hypothetical protein
MDAAQSSQLSARLPPTANIARGESEAVGLCHPLAANTTGQVRRHCVFLLTPPAMAGGAIAGCDARR